MTNKAHMFDDNMLADITTARAEWITASANR